MKQEKKGIAYLIGAGPGDEGLITVRAVACLKQAEVCIYDNLVNEKLLAYTPDTCEMIYVGKKANDHTKTQDEINALLVEKVLAGRIVARLKGGDPFVFGRGGEEALALLAHQAAFEIIPGVTAGVAAAAYAGIPVTHRGATSTVTFITGHEDPTKKESAIEWKALGSGSGTLVFYMGVKNLPEISRQLVNHGRAPETPVAIVRWGTYPMQQVVTGTLTTIAEKAQNSQIKPPAIIIVGEVVALREHLQWYDNRPLFGKKIVVTRSRQQASVLTQKLADLGAHVIELPTIAVEPCQDFTVLDSHIHQIDSFSWIFFTSVNGVDIFFNRLFALHYDARKLSSCRIGVIGNGTGDQLRKYGVIPDFVPETFTSEGMVAGVRANHIDVSGKKVLIPSSDIARSFLPEELEKMGAAVTALAIYHTTEPHYTKESIEAILLDAIDMVTFTSSSTAKNFAAILRKNNLDAYMPKLTCASIGPVTTETAESESFTVAVKAQEHTIDGLVLAIYSYFDK